MNHEDQPAEGPAPEVVSPAEQAETETAAQAEQPDPLAIAPLFQAPDLDSIQETAKARKAEQEAKKLAEELDDGEVVAKRRRRRRRGDSDLELIDQEDDPHTVTKVRTPRVTESTASNKVTSVKGSTRLEAKRQRRRDSRAGGRRRQGITEAEFLARRESVDRQMIVRQKDQRIQIGVLEDGVLAEHFVSETQQDSLIGNVYLGRVQNVLPSMEAAFVDIGRGRNAVLYAGEVNWDASGLDGQPRKIENALKSGDPVLVQVTKDPIGHKGARLTSQISLPGRFLVYVPGGSMTGISRKLPDTERARLKKILKDKLPDGAGVIVRTAAEGAAEQELAHDINRLRAQWEEIQGKSSGKKVQAPELLHQEPDLTIKTVRDVFNEDFSAMVVQGEEAWDNIEAYVTYMAPDLVDRLHRWDEEEDLFDHFRIDEGLAKALDRKVYLPSGGSLVIDRTEAMTVVDVNTGKFTGSGGNLEETVTKNNLEAAEEIVRQLRLRDIGGIIVIDFIDMVLEANRDLVLRRLVECLGRDRTKHQVAEVTSLGLVQMTRKRMGTGLLEVFSEECEHCEGRGIILQDEPIKGRSGGHGTDHRSDRQEKKRSKRGGSGQRNQEEKQRSREEERRAEAARTAFATIAAASKHSEGDASEQNTPSEPAEQTQRADQDAGGEQAESRSAKKRRRRKRAKERQEQPSRTDQAPEQSEGSSAAQPREETSEDSELVVNLHGEDIILPQGRSRKERGNGRESLQGEQGSFTLDSLTEAFEAEDSKTSGPGDQDDSQPAEDQEGAEERPSRTRRSGQRRTGASNRAGREGADAARQAAREALDDLRPGRRGPGQKSQGASQRSQSRGKGAESGRRGVKPQYAQPIDPEPSDGQLPTGVAQPGAAARGEAPAAASSEQGGAGVVETVAAAVPAQELPPVAAKSSRRRRGSRRAASSAGAGGDITTGVEGTAQGGTVVTASLNASAAAGIVGASAEEPVKMLGVGVKAEDIRRPE